MLFVFPPFQHKKKTILYKVAISFGQPRRWGWGPEEVSINSMKDAFGRMHISEFTEYCGITTADQAPIMPHILPPDGIGCRVGVWVLAANWGVTAELSWTLSMAHEMLFLIGMAPVPR